MIVSWPFQIGISADSIEQCTSEVVYYWKGAILTPSHPRAICTGDCMLVSIVVFHAFRSGVFSLSLSHVINHYGVNLPHVQISKSDLFQFHSAWLGTSNSFLMHAEQVKQQVSLHDYYSDASATVDGDMWAWNHEIWIRTTLATTVCKQASSSIHNILVSKEFLDQCHMVITAMANRPQSCPVHAPIVASVKTEFYCEQPACVSIHWTGPLDSHPSLQNLITCSQQ